MALSYLCEVSLKIMLKIDNAIKTLFIDVNGLKYNKVISFAVF